MNFAYIIALIVLCGLYAISIYLMRYIRFFRFFNYFFPILVYIPYLFLCLIVYNDVGFYDWNFQNTLPTANVSPFMFSLMPLLVLLPKNAKKHIFLLISLLTVGMFMSTVIGCLYNASINYKFHHHFLLDYVSHFALSLFGIYLVRSRQVSLTVKSCIQSGSVIFGAATVMLILNLIFDKSFFGLSLNGKHNIYNNVLVDNSYLSALLYYVGLLGVLLLGFLLCKLFDKDKLYLDEKSDAKNTYYAKTH